MSEKVLPTFTNDNGCEVAYETVRQAMNNELFTMSIPGPEKHQIRTAVNQGIDGHLEACFVPSRGDIYDVKQGVLHCTVSVESLPVLLRRLFESEDQEAGLLASDILLCLGIDSAGRFVGREALGLD